MGLRFWIFAAVAGGLAHLMLTLADRQVAAGVDRLAEMRLSRHASWEDDPNLKLVTARSPYMRDER
jgi:hypothetical protein